MTQTWHSDTPPDQNKLSGKRTGKSWLRIGLRGGAAVTVLLFGVAVHFLCRLIEAPIWGQNRPLSARVTVAVCRLVLPCIGLRLKIHGRTMTEPGILVANHSSWLDILVLNACQPLYFVSKAEVAGWPGIGALARITGTVFITRDPKQAAQQKALFEQRLLAGHRLLFFPEGTSTDGLQVIDFKPTLLAALFTEGLRDALSVQPAAVVYHAPKGQPEAFYGWWGDMDFGSHLLKILASPKMGRAEVGLLPPEPVAAYGDRKALARHLQAEITRAHEAARATRPLGQ